MTPDSRSSTKARALANTRHWQSLGQSADGTAGTQALWGECKGSALYQVRIDLHTLTISCSCPSRKQPCKHGLGLLLLAAESPGSFDVGEPPSWVAEWLAKRGKQEKHKGSQHERAGRAGRSCKIHEKRISHGGETSGEAAGAGDCRHGATRPLAARHGAQRTGQR